MSDISAPVAATCGAGANSNCSGRRREHPGPGAHRKRPGGQGHGRAQPDAEGEGGRAQHGETAREGEHAAAAAQPGEGGPGVPGHSRGDGHVRRELAAEEQAQQPGGGSLERAPVPSTGTAPDQPSWSFMFQKPGIWRSAYLARVEASAARDEHRHRDRAEGVTAGRGGQPGVNHDRLIPSHPLPAREDRSRREPDGLRPPRAGRDRRPALLEDARDRPGRGHEPRRRPAALGAVRRLAGSRGAGPFPGLLAGACLLAGNRAGNVVGAAPLRRRPRPVGRP